MQIFTGFSQDMVQDLTGLPAWEIRRIREYGIVVPEKKSTGYKYSFADVLMLRLCHELRYRYDVKLRDIRSAHRFFAKLNPEQSLNEYSLYVRKDTGDILFFGEKYDEHRALISASKFGQLAIKGVVHILPVGRQLEQSRVNVISLDDRLSRSMTGTRLVSLQDLRKKYG